MASTADTVVKPAHRAWLDPFLDILAGTCGGTAGKLIEFPFDTLKVRLQAGGVGLLERYDGTMDAVKKIFYKEGAYGFFRGMSLPLAGTIVETSCLFSTNGALKRMLRERGHLGPDADLPMEYVMLSGAGTGFVVSWVLTPIELIKCRLQVPLADALPSQRYSGPFDCLKRSVRNEGIRVLYRGHVGTILREVPGTMCWFGAYETFVRWMTPVGKSRADLHPMTVVTAGALGGMSYWAIMYPCDTVKSAMQITPPPPPSSAAATACSPAAAAAAAAALSVNADPSSSSPAPSGAPQQAPPTSSQVHVSTSGGVTSSRLQAVGGGPGFASSAPVAAFSTTASASSAAAAPKPHISPSFFHTFLSIYRTMGLRGLYVGLTPTMLRAAPSNAAIFLVYEWSIKHLNRIADEHLT